MDAIFESLEREFCPPLDSSLLAALLADLDLSGTPDGAPPDISTLRSMLIELAVHADEELEDFSQSEETSSVPDFCTTTTTTSFSDMSPSGGGALRSPLHFLQAALPGLPIERLRKALSDVEAADEELDMWDIISTILSEETEREMRERDLDEQEMKEMKDTADADAAWAWETVESKRSPGPGTGTAARKAKKKATKITISDVRQQQHAPRSAGPSRLPRLDDPWAQLTSLSTHVANFLPPHPASFFQSYFHSPDHARTPYTALCAALSAICSSSPSEEDPFSSERYTTTLFNLLDLLLPSYESLNEEGRSRLIADIELALNAAGGRGEDAFELVRVLRDLDSDDAEGVYEMGVYHSPITSPTSERPVPAPVVMRLPTGPAPTPPPPLKMKSATAVGHGKPPSPYQWQAVPQRRKLPRTDPHPLAMHIPAYKTDVNGIKVRGGGNSGGKGGKGDVGELGAYRRRVGESMRKRDEMLKEAARMWQKGNKRTRGGEVAFYFAERAREFQEMAKREALDAARIMVENKRFSGREHDTVDLHGVTAAEAVVLVNEILGEKTWTPEKPLKIITGRGAHSANQVSVLKPAVKKALSEDGWIVGTWDGGLLVRGKRHGMR
ncbi:hypothetical protein FB45DRAFT_926650 [Roridomyces roridus]|uniref:Smr domain-containing protein n=1 Tax=Roridomyces roridus TaxID=1738132 RepID=A0AAD7BKW8_9AGAR|nr:hypothetical protein FB45DRAFT_926650 [Roridomyces roridus]